VKVPKEKNGEDGLVSTHSVLNGGRIGIAPGIRDSN
jgi:hypothetical protein